MIWAKFISVRISSSNRVFPSRAALSVHESRVGKRILDGESNLLCDLGKETDIRLTERIVSESGENQGADRAIPADQRQKTEGLQTFTNRCLNNRVIEPTGEWAPERPEASWFEMPVPEGDPSIE